MPDISMCRHPGCPVKEKCYRYTATPNPFWQAYTSINDVREDGCDLFWDNSKL